MRVCLSSEVQSAAWKPLSAENVTLVLLPILGGGVPAAPCLRSEFHQSSRFNQAPVSLGICGIWTGHIAPRNEKIVACLLRQCLNIDGGTVSFKATFKSSYSSSGQGAGSSFFCLVQFGQYAWQRFLDPFEWISCTAIKSYIHLLLLLKHLLP